MKITKLNVDKITPPIGKNQEFYRDDQLKGFALRVTENGVKSFVLEKLINGKVRRMTLGRYGELTTEQARKEAQKLLGKIATGIDPIAEKRANIASNVTLKNTWDDYIKARKALEPKTLYDYNNVMTKAFPDWQYKPLLSITKDKITKRHAKLGEERGQAYANLSMRLLRALFNFAAGQYEDSQGKSLVTENPVKRLSQTRAWYRIERRQTFIKAHELAAWHAGVMQLQIEKFILPLYANKDAMHNIQHIHRIIKTLAYLAKGCGKLCNREHIIYATYFHGIINSHQKHIVDWLKRQGIPKLSIQKIIKIAKKSQKTAIPETLEEKLLHDAHIIEGGKTFLVLKSLITGVLRGQTLPQTISYFKKNVLNIGKCYLPKAIRIHKQQKQFAVTLLEDLDKWLG